MLPGWDSSQDLRQAIEDRTDSLTIERLALKKGLSVDRLKEKLTRAAGIAPRATANIESEADRLIEREAEIAQKTKSAFAPHHALLDSHARDLDQLEDALQIVSNVDPLQSSGS